MDVKDELDAAHGVAMAQTALLSALIGVLRQSGVLSADQLNAILDAAITQVELSPGMAPEHAARARLTLETLQSSLLRIPAQPRV